MLDKFIYKKITKSFLSKEQSDYLLKKYSLYDFSSAMTYTFDKWEKIKWINSGRNSKVLNLNEFCNKDKVLQKIDNKIIKLLNLSNENINKEFSLLQYDKWDFFKEHYDSIINKNSFKDNDISDRRIYTNIIYLNDTYLWWETHFKYLNESFKWAKGDLLTFNTFNLNWSFNYKSLHESKSIEEWVKYVIVIWYWIKDDFDINFEKSAYDLKKEIIFDYKNKILSWKDIIEIFKRLFV